MDVLERCGCVRKFPTTVRTNTMQKNWRVFSRQPLKKKGDLGGGRGGNRAFVLRFVVLMFVV